MADDTNANNTSVPSASPLLQCGTKCCLSDPHCYYYLHQPEKYKLREGPTFANVDEAVACHAIYSILVIVHEYNHIWMCRPTTATLTSQLRVRNFILKFIDTLAENKAYGVKDAFDYAMLYNDLLSKGPRKLESYAAPTKKDLKRCITLPKVKVSTKPEIDDAKFENDKRVFVEKCKTLFDHVNKKDLYFW